MNLVVEETTHRMQPVDCKGVTYFGHTEGLIVITLDLLSGYQSYESDNGEEAKKYLLSSPEYL